MKYGIAVGTACFLLGVVVGFWTAPKQKNAELSKPLMLQLTSQGRAEMRKAVQDADSLLDETVGDIMAEQTLMLQAISAKEPDRTKADFYLSGMEEKISRARTAVNKRVLDAIEKMPLIDRRTYMKFYLKNRNALKERGIIVPLTAFAGFSSMDDAENPETAKH